MVPCFGCVPFTPGPKGPGTFLFLSQRTEKFILQIQRKIGIHWLKGMTVRWIEEEWEGKRWCVGNEKCPECGSLFVDMDYSRVHRKNVCRCTTCGARWVPMAL